MKYLNATFSVPGGGKQYGEGYDRTFGEKRARSRCVCPTPKIGYRLNKVPICGKCNGVMGEGRREP